MLEKMKPLKISQIASALMLSALLGTGCTESGSKNDSQCQRDALAMTLLFSLPGPVMTVDSPTSPVLAESQAPRPLIQPGKIYRKDNYIYVNELYAGIHVIDNTTPLSPVNIAYWSIPNNVDLAIRDNILYADSLGDLLAIDISDPSSIQVTKRLENFFYHEYRVMDYNYGYPSSNTIFVCEDGRVEMMFSFALLGGTATATGSDGQGGSLSRFALKDNHLHALSDDKIKTADISVPAEPALVSQTEVDWGIETIHVQGDRLFLGSQFGMYIYDVTDPTAPTYVSDFQHARACDPVVVNGNYAYVTLRSGTSCGAGANQLDIINITDITSPVLVKTMPMTAPRGLGIDGTSLFVCDGAAGLNVYSLFDPANPALVTQVTPLNAQDVILKSGNALVTGSGGIHQYDYTGLPTMTWLSTVPVE